MTQDEKDLIKDLLNLEDGLSSWEIDFIENLNKEFQNQELSEKQKKVLDRLAAYRPIINIKNMGMLDDDEDD